MRRSSSFAFDRQVTAAPSPALVSDRPVAWRGKRLADAGFALLLLVPSLPVMVAIWATIVITERRPALYLSERMRTPGQAFSLLKFRTLADRDERRAQRVLGGDSAHRITPLGRRLRASRLDELPQLFNILRGDMSLVGPRPPLRLYVESHPALYAAVLRSRPGLTGLATVMFHSHEEAILRASHSAEQTDALYARRCVPRKARLDLLYQRRQGARLDAYVIYLTIARFLPLPGRRAARLRKRAQMLDTGLRPAK